MASRPLLRGLVSDGAGLKLSDDYSEPLEVTREDHLQTVSGSSPNVCGVPRRISSMVQKKALSASRSTPRRRNGGRKHISAVLSPSKKGDVASVHTAEGAKSLANHSLDTVKASNRAPKVEPPPEKRWLKLKRLIGVKTAPEQGIAISRQLSADEAFPRKSFDPMAISRSRSADSEIKTRVASSGLSETQQYMLDQSIRCRFDGIDVLSLAKVQCGSSSKRRNRSAKPWDSLPDFTFTGTPRVFTPAQVVYDMLRCGTGDAAPEIILEGFLPGGDDRWSVRIEECRTQSSPKFIGRNPENSSLQFGGSGGAISSEDGSPNTKLASQRLWEMVWGEETTSGSSPCDLDDSYESTSDDSLLEMAAECSIPFDTDEDTFVITCRDHVNSIHEIASVPLSSGRFDAAQRVFEKLLKGIVLTEVKGVKFLKGTTLHNIGLIQMWRSDYDGAAASFEKAFQERIQYLPKNHPDLVVTLVRKAMALFALERFELAVASLEVAHSMTHPKCITRAKILNNLGVVYFQQKDFSSALKEFTKSLEVQRAWLLGDSLRRQTLVYDCSIPLTNMGKIYMERTDYDLAFQVFEEAVLLQTSVFRKDDDVVLSSLKSMAVARVEDGKLEEGMRILHSCLRSQNSRFGVGSEPSIETVGLLGFMHAMRKEYLAAQECLKTCTKWQTSNLVRGHPSLLKTEECLVALEALSTAGNTAVWI